MLCLLWLIISWNLLHVTCVFLSGTAKKFLQIGNFQLWLKNSVGLNADFETLTLCIFKTNVYLCLPGLSTWTCLYLVANSIFNDYLFFNWFYYPHPVAMGLRSHEICVWYQIMFEPLGQTLFYQNTLFHRHQGKNVKRKKKITAAMPYVLQCICTLHFWDFEHDVFFKRLEIFFLRHTWSTKGMTEQQRCKEET